MPTRTTTIRVDDVQLQLLEAIAERDECSVADVQRTAFREYINPRVKADEALRAVLDSAAQDRKDKDQARTQESIDKAVGPIT